MTMSMNSVNAIMEVWQKLESDCADGLVKRALDIPTSIKTYCTCKSPEKYLGIAFSFHQDIKLNISVFQDLSELSISLFKDNSFPNSQLLLIQLNNREQRVNDIFASICGNIVNAISGVESEREGVRLVIAQLRKWKDLFSKRRNKELSTQEQQGLYGELFFLRKLINLIDRVKAITTWVGPEMAPKDFQSDMWAVEVKTSTAATHSGISINGELQLDESSFEHLFLYNLIVEVSQQEGESLPGIIADIRILLSGDNKASVALEEKLLLAGYYDLDEDHYKDRYYQTRKEYYFRVKDDFPRIKKDELRKGVSEVKYNISLDFSDENKIIEADVIKVIESYEGNQ